MLLETVLLAAIIGPFAFETLLEAAPRLYRHLADPPRRRQRQLIANAFRLC